MCSVMELLYDDLKSNKLYNSVLVDHQIYVPYFDLNGYKLIATPVQKRNK